jgi:ABC-type glycerol-3-phosphate transport system substrate-binding protein
MLDIAAPELYGRFNIAPIPGKEAEDGTIIRYGAGSVSSAMIFKNSTKQQESWEFLKWWTDENTQIRFDSEIEAKIGPTGRWFSANLNAFYSLPWGQHRSEVIKDWMPWYRNPVNTLGGYMTPRAINNAWTRTVMSSMKTRDSLEQAFDEISIEMERKQLEYGVK